ASGPARRRHFANNAAGQAITVVGGGYTSPTDINAAFVRALQGVSLLADGVPQHFLFANGQAVGSITGSRATFDVNRTPVSEDQGLAPGSHVVQSGDTLRSLAQSFYGDAKLWYIIADANGLASDPDEELQLGTLLTLPNDVVALSND